MTTGIDGSAASGTDSNDRPPGVLGSSALPAGFRLHEYSLDNVLGYGGFGITYLATDHNLNCKVAIKEYLPSDQAVRNQDQSITPRSADSVETFQWGLARFLDEARALATFNHPNIVRVMRFFEAHGTAYMVMELVTGDALGRWAKRHHPVDEARLLGIVRPLLDGLQVIHNAGFLHRDIKPGNIHVRADRVPVLLDFGAARQLVGRGDAELTAIVTPGYGAFEQYYSNGNQGPWTDIYSMAAVMYAMITGQRPIEAPARIRNDPLKKLADIADRRLYSEQLLHAIDWALIPDENKRPRTVLDFLRALPAESTQSATPAGTFGGSTVMHAGDAEPVSAPSSFGPALIASLEAALAAHLGPMAGVIVRRKAKLSPNLESLRRALADDIDSEQSRRVFMHKTEGLLRDDPVSRPHSQPVSAPRPEPTAPTGPSVVAAGNRFDDTFLAAVEVELAHHLGPLARLLIKKSAAKARDRAELFLMLSDNIADEGQRRAFIRKSVAAFKDKN